MADNSSRFGRAPSVSSAGTASTNGAYSFVPRYTPKPEPSYISASSAADHITHRQYHENYDLLSPRATPVNDRAEFSPSALALLNSFLDSLLYNFLQKSRSTTLSKLRLAILEILKAKLGREALASADEELEGLLGDSNDDDGADIDDASVGDSKDIPRRSSTPSIDWHLESAFKRMRLRVMVFIRLGDFDDEDEEKFLGDDASNTNTALDQSILSSPAAVYLASVLECLAEQTLSLAGDAAYARSKSKTRRAIREDSAVNNFDDEGVIVEDIDVEKIALNPSLGRLWRTWRKNQRSITSPTSPKLGVSRRSSLASPSRSTEDILRRQSIRRSGSNQIMQTLDAAAEEPHEEAIPDCEPSETDIAANIPIPLSTRDIDEIEIPGLATVVYDDDEEPFDDDEDDTFEHITRPRSMSLSMPGKYAVEEPVTTEEDLVSRPLLTRQRSNSLPYSGIVPWGWIPASVRRALAKLAEMSDVELAAITPLPDDDEEVDSDTIAATAGNDETESKIADDTVLDEPISPKPEAIAEVDDTALTQKEVDDEKKSSATHEESDHDRSHKLESAAIIGTAVAGAAAAGATIASHRKNSQAVDDEASRAGTEFVPKSILKQSKPSSHTSLGGSSADSFSDAVTVQDAAVNGEADDRQKPLLSVYAPKKASAEDATSTSPVRTRKPSHDTSIDTAATGNPAGLSGSPRAAFPAALGRKVSFKDENLVDEVPYVQGRPGDGVDSKLSSPMHIANLVQNQSGRSPVQQDAAVKQATAKIPERKDSNAAAVVSNKTSVPGRESATQAPVMERSPVSPIEESPTFPKSNVQDQTVALAPVVATPPNPYAMLYDDVEPEAIGVAKTSNIPIHTPTPPSTSESRPWTPNRGARSSSQTNVHAEALSGAALESRNRTAPSPLRVSNQQPTSARSTDSSASQTRAVAPATDDYDLDKPIDPGRFQNWNRPKESPTIPKFYNAPVSTPTDSQRPNSIQQTGVDHSPKGSQASGRSSNKRASEELKEREFDALLDRKETVKYTLTPEEIRDVGPYSPNSSNERKVPAPIETGRNSSTPAAMSPTLLRKSPQAQTTATPQPVVTNVQPSTQPQVKVQEPVVQPAQSQLRPLKISEIRKSISALSPEPVEPRKRRSGLMAREPRVLGGETKDFVDFIRSCTPTSEDQVRPAALTNRWSAGLQTGSTRSTKSSMVPREPDVRTTPSGDLIQFIRSGPPNAQGGMQNGMQNGNKNANKDKPLPTNPKAPVIAASIPPQVTRKTRRKRDPYAIDTDDEDEDDFTALPGARTNGASQSENLQEFLRSTSPPPVRVNGYTNGVSSPQSATAGQRSASAADARFSQGHSSGLSGPGIGASQSSSLRGAPESMSRSFFSRKKYEPRPAGATRSFGGHGFHYSTNDLADYLRSSGPNRAMANGGAPNGIVTTAEHVRSESMTTGSVAGRLTPSGSIGMKRGDSTRRRLFGRKQMEA